MLETIRLATPSDMDDLIAFYEAVCAHEEHDEFAPGWDLGVYPTANDLLRRVRDGVCHLGFANGRLACAMALTPQDDEEYAGFPWKVAASPEEASVIHLLAVHPDFRGQGLGAELTDEAIRLSRAWGKRAVHLDVMPGNLAASRVYERCGFEYAGDHTIFYEDTGEMRFWMYERAL